MKSNLSLLVLSTACLLAIGCSSGRGLPPAAGLVYRKLKKLAPQSDETIQSRELIKAAVINR